MSNRIVQRVRKDAIEKTVEEAAGFVSVLPSFTSDLAAWLQISDMEKLPVLSGNPELQNPSGDFIFMIGYSQVGGPDVIG